MSRIISVLILMYSLSACQSTSPAVTKEVSSSGLNYSLVSMPGNSRITLRVAWPTPWSLTDGTNKAVPHIGSDLVLAGGADGYSSGEVNERFNDIKSEGRLLSTVEYVIGTLHFSPEHQDETLKIANMHIKDPSLDEKWFERIRDGFGSRMAESSVRADSKGFEAMRWAIFGEQPIREALSLDVPKTIENVLYDDVRKWAETSFFRTGATIVIAGDLTASQADDVVDTLFSGLPERAASNDANSDIKADFSPKTLLYHTPDEEVSNLTFIARMPLAKDAEEFEDAMLVMALGVGEKSVLFKTVRAQLGASYTYGASVSAFATDFPVLIMSGQVETSKIAEAEQAIRQAYATFREDGYKADLALSKKPLQQNVTETVKDTGSMAYAVMSSMIRGDDIKRALLLETEVDSITAESLNKRLSSYPSADEFMVIVTTSDEDALPDACVVTEPAQAVNC